MLEDPDLNANNRPLCQRLPVTGCCAHARKTRNSSSDTLLDHSNQQIAETVSHELRTPLTSILGVLELLSLGFLGPLEERAKSRIAFAESDVQRMLKLLNDLLECAKVRNREVKLNVREVNLQEVIDHAVQVIATTKLAQQRRIQIHTAVSCLPVNVDRERIIQVMINLLANAVEHSPEDGVVQVFSSQGGRAVEISVLDAGCGIPEDCRNTIFERFQQLKPQPNQGTGLGLSIAKSIVEAHGGRIGVKRQMPNGSRFWFRLPNAPQETSSAPD